MRANVELTDADHILRLLLELDERLDKINDKIYYDDDLFRISCAVLKIIYRNLDPAGIVNLEYLDFIDQDIELGRKYFFKRIGGGEENPFAIANQLPLYIASLIIDSGAGILVGKDFASMIKNTRSDVRLCTFRTLWLVKDRLDNPGVIQGLLYNLAENLGFISEAAGLLRGIVGDDGRFFLAASKYEPPTIRKDQFEARINQIRNERLLSACMKLLADYEEEIVELEKA